MDCDPVGLHLLIVAAGSGRRMGSERNKLLLPLEGRPLLAWTLEAALASRSIEWIGLVGQERDRQDIEAIVASFQAPKPVQWVQGGDSRQASVANGLTALPVRAEHVLIHDGARCLAEPELFDRCSRSLLSTGEALIAATPVVDTIKQVDGQQCIVHTPPRAALWAAQTPQGFPVEQLRQAHRRALDEGWEGTDDAALFERLGWPVRVLEASGANLKITTPLDLELAAALLRRR